MNWLGRPWDSQKNETSYPTFCSLLSSFAQIPHGWGARINVFILDMKKPDPFRVCHFPLSVHVWSLKTLYSAPFSSGALITLPKLGSFASFVSGSLLSLLLHKGGLWVIKKPPPAWEDWSHRFAHWWIELKLPFRVEIEVSNTDSNRPGKHASWAPLVTNRTEPWKRFSFYAVGSRVWLAKSTVPLLILLISKRIPSLETVHFLMAQQLCSDSWD